MQYMIIFDEQDRALIDDTLAEEVRSLREDDDDHNNRLATRLEALAIVPAPTGTPQDVDQASEAVIDATLWELDQASMSQTAATRQAVIDGLQREVDQLQASLILIRAEIEELYSHPWNPRSFHVLGALYPNRYAIEQAAMKLAAQREGESY